MVVTTNSESLIRNRRTIVENLLYNGHHNCLACEANGRCELQDVAYWLGIKSFETVEEPEQPKDVSSELIMMNPNKCIVCGRCIAACNDVVGNNVLTFSDRGYHREKIDGYGARLGTG